MKMKKILTTLGLLAVIGTIMMPTTKTFAYDKETYTYDNQGNYLVDNAASRTNDNKITLNVLVPKSSTLEGTLYYKFKCLTNNFKDYEYFDEFGYGVLAYKSRFDTYKEIAEVGTGKVVSFQFNVENGTYVFSTNDCGDIVTLTPDLTNPLEFPINYTTMDTAIASIKDFPVTLTNESLNLYAIYGDIDFVKDNAKALADYANGKANTTGISTSNDSQKNDIENALGSISNTDDEDLKALADALASEDNNIEATPSSNGNVTTSSDGVNVSTNTETVKNKTDTKTNGFSIKNTIILAIGVIVIIGAIIFFKKKK